MNLEHAAAASTSRSFGPSDVHLSGSFRLLARGGWLVLVILTLAPAWEELRRQLLPMLANRLHH